MHLQRSATGTVRFSWIDEAWRLYSAEAGPWSAAITIAGLVNVAVFCCGIWLFGVWRAIIPFTADPLSAKMPDLSRTPGWWMTGFATTVASAYVYAGLQKMANLQLRGGKLRTSMVFGGSDVFPNYLGYTLLASIPDYVNQLVNGPRALGIVIGILGFIVAVYTAPGYACVADGCGAMEAILLSFRGVQRNVWMAFAFYIAFGAIVVVSALACLIGLIVTTPMITVLLSLAYRDLIGMSDGPGGGAVMPPNGPGSGQVVWPPSPRRDDFR